MEWCVQLVLRWERRVSKYEDVDELPPRSLVWFWRHRGKERKREKWSSFKEARGGTMSIIVVGVHTCRW